MGDILGDFLTIAFGRPATYVINICMYMRACFARIFFCLKILQKKFTCLLSRRTYTVKVIYLGVRVSNVFFPAQTNCLRNN
jgi:hypothetical protein